MASYEETSVIKDYILTTPLWSISEDDEDIYDYTYKLKKPVKIIVFPDSENLMNITQEFIKNNNTFKKSEEYQNFIKKHNVDEDDYEYELAYYIFKFTEFKGWMTDSAQYGFFILCGDTQEILTLENVKTYKNKEKVVYTPEQWELYAEMSTVLSPNII